MSYAFSRSGSKDGTTTVTVTCTLHLTERFIRSQVTCCLLHVLPSSVHLTPLIFQISQADTQAVIIQAQAHLPEEDLPAEDPAEAVETAGKLLRKHKNRKSFNKLREFHGNSLFLSGNSDAIRYLYK